MSIIAIIFNSCTINEASKDKNVEIIKIADLTPLNISISNFTTHMEVVKFETSEECLLGGMITHLKISNDQIFVKDNIFNGVYVFDKKGSYMYKLHQFGQGPGEYLQISDFIIDEQSNTIEILDTRSRKIFIYDLNSFSFIKDIPISLNVASVLAKKDNMYYLGSKGLRNIINDKPTNSNIIAFNPNTGQYKPLFDKLRPDNEHQALDFSNPYTINSQNEIFVSIMWQNYLYKIEDEQISPIFLIDAGKHDIPDDIKEGSYDQKHNYLYSSSSSNDKYWGFKMQMFEETNFIFASTKGKDIHYYIRFNGSDFFTNKIQNDFIPEKTDIDLNASFILGNYLITILTPEEDPLYPLDKYMDYFKIKPEDNPTLLLFKFKN